MSEIQSVPQDVTNEENIARVILSPMMVEDEDVSPSAFFLRDLKPPEDFVSVIRHNYMMPTPENVSMIRVPKGNTLYGYALINAGICRNITYKDIMIEVLSHPTKKNPYHAGIHYSKSGNAIKGSCTDPDFIIVAGMLANKSELKSF